MVKCAVPSCKNDSRKQTKKKNDISFHRFPKSREMANKWVTAIKRRNWEPNIWSFVCSLHFKASSFYETKSRLRRLVKDAIPEVKLEDEVKEDSVISSIEEKNMVPSISQPLSNKPTNDTVVPSTSENLAMPVTEENIVVPSVDDTPRKRKLKRQIINLQEIAKRRRLRCNALYLQKNRFKKKIESLTKMLTHLRKKQLITQEHNDILEICGASAAELFKRLCHKSSTYSSNLRSFALTLHFYSPKAYAYVRDTFNTCLPHPSTIRKWYTSVNASPGFTEEAFKILRAKTQKSESKVICSLIFDEMSIRQLEEYDGNSVHGYVDFGAGVTGNVNELATQALVFLLVAINESWKLPVAYFFVNGVSAEQKANLLNNCLINSHEAGVDIVSVTFDGCPTNIAMAKLLGCSFNFNDDNHFKTCFSHPSNGNDVAIFLDPCHMMKLIRNTLENKKKLKDQSGGLIKWDYFVKLNDFQEKEYFHFANKLTNRHIFFKDQKMKVKLAVQLLSSSVAKAIEFCDKDLGIPEFANSEATVKFIRIMNNFFDLLNSRKFPNIDFKEPINERNKIKYFNFLDSTFYYIKNLMLMDEDKHVVNSRNKVGFLGICICIKSLEALYLKLITKDRILKFIPTYKISQDHLELLFSVIRSHGGFNNNPSALQFKAIYKKMLTHMELRQSRKGNCFPLENISILTCSSSADHINLTTVGYRSKTDEIIEMTDEMFFYNNWEEEYALPDVDISNPSQQVISYIAGYVVRYLIKKLVCVECQSALISREKTSHHTFIICKDRGGLLYPSNDVVNICLQAENVVKRNVIITENKNKHGNVSKVSIQYITNEILKIFIGKDIFVSLHEHIFNQEPCSNHLVHLLRAIIQKYVDIRIKYLLRKPNAKETKRQLYNKLVLFKGQ